MDTSKLSGTVPDSVIAQLDATIQQYPAINSEYRVAHLMGQAKEESEGYTHTHENLHYSGDALWSIFHTHFTDRNEAESYGRQPERIANRIYANRIGNGDESSGDGWNYRGRGYLQITGKDNYQAMGDAIGVDLVSNPDLVESDYPMMSAAWFFDSHNLWSICDKGVDAATITIVTEHVNGGQLGLSARVQYTTDIYNALTA
jgi:putative chitinase